MHPYTVLFWTPWTSLCKVWNVSKSDTIFAGYPFDAVFVAHVSGTVIACLVGFPVLLWLANAATAAAFWAGGVHVIPLVLASDIPDFLLQRAWNRRLPFLGDGRQQHSFSNHSQEIPSPEIANALGWIMFPSFVYLDVWIAALTSRKNIILPPALTKL